MPAFSLQFLVSNTTSKVHDWILLLFCSPPPHPVLLHALQVDQSENVPVCSLHETTSSSGPVQVFSLLLFKNF